MKAEKEGNGKRLLNMRERWSKGNEEVRRIQRFRDREIKEGKCDRRVKDIE